MEENGMLVRVLDLSDGENVEGAHVHPMLLSLELVN